MPSRRRDLSLRRTFRQARSRSHGRARRTARVTRQSAGNGIPISSQETIASPTGRRLESIVSVLETHPTPNDMRADYDKRLMLVSGRGNPELAARIASKLDV